MLRRCFSVCPLALTMVVLWASLAGAQHYQPFADLDFDNEFQWFAPAVTTEYGGEPVAANVGWFFTYDRVYINMTRPQYTMTSWDGDFTWGNRLDFGYMTEERHGWLMTAWKVGGPAIYSDELPSHTGIGDETITVTDPITLLPITLNVTDTINVADMSGFELNKSFRLRPLHDGTFIEPFFGARFIKVTDFFRVSGFSSVGPLDTTVTAHGEVENNMIGGQFGARVHFRRGHWILSSEARMFALQNFQFHTKGLRTTVVDTDNAVTTVNRQDTSEDQQEFVYGGELRVEAAYEITREIALRVGLELFEFGQGIGRGVGPRNDEDLTLVGVTFGVTLNR